MTSAGASGGPDAKRNWYFTEVHELPAIARCDARAGDVPFLPEMLHAPPRASRVDRDRAALVSGQERGFTFRIYNAEGLDVTMLREVVEAVRYEGARLR